MSNRRQRPGRTNTGNTTHVPVSAPQRLPQDAPTRKEVPRPKVWEPVNLHNKAEWEIDNLDLSDRVEERFASLFDKRPQGWTTEKGDRRIFLQYVARTHANYGRLKVHKQISDGNGWSEAAVYDDSWHAQRLLGAGSFGRVGLWIRRDRNNQIVDEMAIKEEDYEEDSLWTDGLPEEAVTNEFMNRGGVENIQQLRGFKSFPTLSDNPVLKYKGTERDRRWRYYFEYAPHGPLERLIARYRAWNQYLPESFLWHVFDGLAQVLLTFEETQPDLKEHRKSMLRAADRLVHFDIKPSNIFLGYERPFDSDADNYGGHRSNVYPMIKIGDFGLAAMTSHRDPQNPAGRFWNRGTKYYHPPEQMHYGATFPIPPNGRFLPLQNELGQFVAIEQREGEANPAGIHLTQPMNVWGVGKVMYDLATLSHCYQYAGLSTQKYDEYTNWNSNAIEDFQRNPFIVSNRAKDQDDPSPSPYGPELMDVIELCMKPAANNRIKAREVKNITEKMMARYGSDEGLEMNEKVYFIGNEINNMPQGGEDFPFHKGNQQTNTLRRTSRTELEELMDYSVDPDEPELQPPRWPRLLRTYKTNRDRQIGLPHNSYWAENCRIVDGKVLFRLDATSTDGADDQTSCQDDEQVNNQDQPAADAPDPDDAASAQQPAQTFVPTAPRGRSNRGGRTASGSGGIRKGGRGKSAPPRLTAGRGSDRNPAAQVAFAATSAASQAPTNTQTPASVPAPAPPPPTFAPPLAPRRARLPRAAKQAAVGKYKV